MTNTTLITGVTGQDGAYLAELLLEKGYTIDGIKRRAGLFNTDRVDHLYHDPHEQGVRFFMHYGDLTDATNLVRIIQETQPDELYSLARGAHCDASRPVDLGFPAPNRPHERSSRPSDASWKMWFPPGCAGASTTA